MSKDRKTRVTVTPEMEEKFRECLIQTNSVPKASKHIGVARRTGYDIKDRLIARGEIENVGYKSPGLYVENLPPTEEEPVYAQERWGPISVPDVPKWWASDDIDNDGVWTPSKPDDQPPEGFSRCHLSNGMMGVPVLIAGDRDDLRDGRGFVYGYWSKDIVKNDRYTQYPVDIRMKGYRILGYYRVGSLGASTLRFNLENVWLDPILYPDHESIIRLFEKRMGRICALLETHGWKFGDSFEFHGGVHFAFPDHIWGDTLDRIVKLDDGQIIADHSHGKIEVELENGNTPEGLTSAQILGHAPANILGLSRKASELTMEVIDLRSDLILVKETLAELRPVIKELAENQLLESQVSAEQARTLAHILQTNGQLSKQVQSSNLPPYLSDPKEGYQ